MKSSNRSRSKFDNSNTNSNNEFTREFSFLFKNISEPEIESAIKHGDHKKYRKLIKDHDATFIEIPERSLSPLHFAVTCRSNTDTAIETISSVLQSGIDINHLDEHGNTPLMHVLNDAKKLGKKCKKDFISRVKFLMERGASLGWSEEECEEESNQINRFIKQIVTNKGELDNIYRAQQDLKEKAKKELSAYVQDIKDVSIYGNCAKIQLKGNNKEEFKISEFLQSDFCKNNGISGFSTLHENGKSGIHCVVSPEGIRHYAVTDSLYEVTLDWPANGVKHTIKIHMNVDGDVEVDKEYLDQYEAGKIDVAANKYVKLGDLYLAEALARGRWKAKQVQNEVQNNMSETIRSGVMANHLDTPEIEEFTPLMTSTPLSHLPDPRGVSPISYAGNHSPLSPEGNTFFEKVFNEQNGTPKSQESNGWDDSPFPPIPSNSALESQQHNGSQERPKKTPPPTPVRRSSLPEGQRQLENLQQPVVQQQSVGHQNSEDEGNDHLINKPRSGRENVGKSNPSQLEKFLKEIRERSKQDNRGLKKANLINESPQNEAVSEPSESQINSKEDQEKRDRRKALQEANSKDRIYSLKQLFDELPQNEDVSELQKKFDQEKYGLKTVTTTNESPQSEDVSKLLAKLKSVNTDGMSAQTRKHLIEAGLLTDEVSTDSEQLSSPRSQSDSGISSPTHTSHSESQVDTQELEERLTNIVEQNHFDEEVEIIDGEEWDSTYDFPLHDDSGFEEEFEALETLSKEFEDEEKNEQIDSETAELKNAPADQVMSELKGVLSPNNRKIPQDSNLGKLLEKNAKQLEIEVIEGEDTSEKSAIADGFDRNRVKRSNQGIQLSKKIQQPWAERVTTSTDNKDKGIS